MIDGGDFEKWLQVFNIQSGGGGGGGVTSAQVQRSAFNFAAGVGANDAFIVNLNPAVTSYTNGLLVTMVSGFTNLTTTPTLKLNGLAPITIVTSSGSVLIPSDIVPNTAYLFVYDSANNNFQIINPSISNANSYLVQKNYFNYAADTGAINAYVATLPFSPLVVLAAGLPCTVEITTGNTNTGASTLTLNGSTAPIVTLTGAALTGGEIVGGGMCMFVYSDVYNSFILMNPLPQPSSRNPTTTITTTPFSAVVNNNYVVNVIGSQCVIQLPNSCNEGDTIIVQGISVDGWQIIAGSGQQIIFGNQTSAVNGSLTNVYQTDNVSLLCIVANSLWSVEGTTSTGLSVN